MKKQKEEKESDIIIDTNNETIPLISTDIIDKDDMNKSDKSALDIIKDNIDSDTDDSHFPADNKSPIERNDPFNDNSNKSTNAFNLKLRPNPRHPILNEGEGGYGGMEDDTDVKNHNTASNHNTLISKEFPIKKETPVNYRHNEIQIEDKSDNDILKGSSTSSDSDSEGEGQTAMAPEYADIPARHTETCTSQQ